MEVLLAYAGETWGAELETLVGHSGTILTVAFSPCGQLVSSSAADGTVRLWDPTTGVLQQILEGHPASVYSVAFSLDSRLLVSGERDTTAQSETKTIWLWNTSRGEFR